MATPAEPILASAIWNADLTSKQDKLDEHLPKRRKLALGHTTVDDVLDGGFDYGSISCINAQPDGGLREISHAVLASHLLSSPLTASVYIDASQTLDIRELHENIQSTLQERGFDEAAARTEGLRALDHLRIMQVFDLVGLSEGLAEVRDELENRSIGREQGLEARNQSPQLIPPPPRGTIADSQGDEEDEDAMLDEPAPPATTGPTIPLTSNATKDNPDFYEPYEAFLLIINDLPHLVTPLLKTNQAQGNALLTAQLRSLAHLTRRHSLCTLLLNLCSTPQRKQQRFSQLDESPSAFASCTVRPLLGRNLAEWVDLNLLLHAMEKGGRGEDGENLRVLEVVADKNGERAGRWTAFAAGDLRLPKDR